MSESEFVASLSAHELYLSSAVCRDHEAELMAMLESARDSLEIEESVDEIRRLQGICRACRRFITLPTVIVEALREEIANGEK